MKSDSDRHITDPTLHNNVVCLNVQLLYLHDITYIPLKKVNDVMLLQTDEHSFRLTDYKHQNTPEKSTTG